MRETHGPPWEEGMDPKQVWYAHVCSIKETHLENATSLPGSGSPGLLLV